MQIKREIADFEAKGVAMEKDRQVILKQLEQRQTTAAQSGDNADKNYKAVLKVLDQLRTGTSDCILLPTVVAPRLACTVFVLQVHRTFIV